MPEHRNIREILGQEIRCKCAEYEAEIARLKELLSRAVLHVNAYYHKNYDLKCEISQVLEEGGIKSPKANQGIQWVSVKDRLPEEDGVYLFATGFIAWVSLYRSQDEVFETEEGCFDVNEFSTHWAEINLPEDK